MTLSESIEAATSIVDRYPNGGKSAGKSYLGALAATLASYPKQVATKCADLKGISADCQFLPTVADIIAWCERNTEPLRQQRSAELRRADQLEARARFEQEQIAERSKHLTINELKEKYGDWGDGWRRPGLLAQERYDAARAALVGQIGEDAFNALPSQKGAAE